MDDEKYVVFKKSEWDEAGEADVLDALEPLSDAVVIRTQDAFAAAGLSAYWHIILLYTERLNGHMTPELIEVRDYFEWVSREATDRLLRGECSLPD
jgi:hypothetical protein